MFIDNENDNVH